MEAKLVFPGPGFGNTSDSLELTPKCPRLDMTLLEFALS